MQIFQVILVISSNLLTLFNDFASAIFFFAITLTSSGQSCIYIYVYIYNIYGIYIYMDNWILVYLTIHEPPCGFRIMGKRIPQLSSFLGNLCALLGQCLGCSLCPKSRLHSIDFFPERVSFTHRSS